jgi:Protein of unknown function with PCYCGC motif
MSRQGRVMIVGPRRLFQIVGGVVLVVALVAGGLSLRRADSSMSMQASTQAFDLSKQPAQIVDLYRFVEGSPSLAAVIPCYCGCGPSPNLGHESLLDCFILPDGSGYESHAALCAICTGEADDIRRLSAEGTESAAIRTWIDEKYGKYGVPTDTPRVDEMEN